MSIEIPKEARKEAIASIELYSPEHMKERIGNIAPDPMLDYYRRRAAYYERVYHKPHRQADLRAMEAWLPSMFTHRSVLEIACGTGWWTPHGAREAERWLAIDAHDETLAVARSKLLPDCVELRLGDAYTLAEVDDERFDAAFAACWWSHVPLQRLDTWLATLHATLAPGARVVFLDNRYVEGDSTPLSRFDQHGNGYQARTLDDGSVHEVLKNFPDEAELNQRLAPCAHDIRWQAWPHYWACSYTLR